MTNPAVRIETTDSVLSVTFARPRSLNALATPMLHAAAEAIEAAVGEPAVRVVVITGGARRSAPARTLPARTASRRAWTRSTARTGSCVRCARSPSPWWPR